MFWYVIICVLMIYPLTLSYAGKITGKKSERIALVVACFILWFFMAFRAISVGVDTKYYAYVHTQFPDISFTDIFSAETFAVDDENWSFDFEPGYRIYNKLVSRFSADPQAITVANATLLIFLWYGIIKKQSPQYLTSVWLYITLGRFQTEMNVTRNAIAILIVYSGMPLVEQKKWGKFLSLCCVAGLFHKAAFAFLLVYPLVCIQRRWTGKRMVIALMASAAAGVAVKKLTPFLTLVLPGRLARYLSGGGEKIESILVGVLNLALFLTIYLLMNKKERGLVFERCHTGTTLFVMNLCCFVLSTGMGYAARAAALFGPYMIVYIPQMIAQFGHRDKKDMVTGLIAVCCGCQYLLRLCVNNIGGTMPYSFFW